MRVMTGWVGCVHFQEHSFAQKQAATNRRSAALRQAYTSIAGLDRHFLLQRLQPVQEIDARCPWLAAVKMARLSSLSTLSQSRYGRVVLARLKRQIEVGTENAAPS